MGYYTKYKYNTAHRTPLPCIAEFNQNGSKATWGLLSVQLEVITWALHLNGHEFLIDETQDQAALVSRLL
jgi:hypothetical protein